MSKMYSLILFLFISLSVLADHPKNGKITITTYDQQHIRVDVDGRRYTGNDNTIRIANVNPGYHTVRVYRMQAGGLFGGTRERLVYSGNIQVKPDHRIDIYIDRNGRAEVDERDLSKKRKNNKNKKNRRDDDDDRWDDYDRRNDNDRDRRNDRRDRDDDRWGNDRQRDDRWSNDRRDDDRLGRDERYGRPISNDMFQSMKQTLRRENFENTRLTLAKQMMDRNSFESSQVRELLQLFSFENNRLELAKMAYRNTVDKRNYFVVYDVFSFQSSKEDLANYIRNYR